MVLNEKAKNRIKKITVYLVVFALGITIGVLSIKGTFDYKEMSSLTGGMSFRAYTCLISLDNLFNTTPNDYERLYEDAVELSFIAGLIGRSDGVFLNESDRYLTNDEWAALFECSVKAKFIARDFVAGRDVSYEDKEWLENFGIAVAVANRNPDYPSYKLFAEQLLKEGLYSPTQIEE